MTVKLLFMSGSARTGSFNTKLARLGHAIADANGIHSAFADLADYPLPLYSGDIEHGEGVPENAVKLADFMSLHEGVVICSPEYNASLSPMLKNTLDWISRIRDGSGQKIPVFTTRVFALCSASPGGMGGLRGLNATRTVLEMGLGALVIPEQFAVPRSANAFDENGHLNDKDAQDRYKALIERLAKAAQALHGPDA